MSRSITLALVVLALTFTTACGERAPDAEAEAAAAARAEALAADAKAREEAAVALEAQRLTDLWTYHDTAAGNGRQLTAAISSTENVDTDGQGAKPVRLIFRDHPSWGRSSYLVLQAGDFNCYSGCTLQVTVDSAAPTAMAGRRPNTDEAIAMFINDARALWRMTSGAKRLTVEFPVKAGGTRTASFDIGGLTRSKIPGWDGPAGTAPATNLPPR